MNAVLSWIKDFVDIDTDPITLAQTLTMLGLEIESITLVGVAVPETGIRHQFKVRGIQWDPEKIVVAQIDEVLPHPNADRLVLCRLQDGQQEHLVLTGAPNLFEYKGQGALAKPLKVAYAKEGARIYDGHQPGQVLTTLKRAKIRGVESYSMVCSEKELGISDEHEGIILLEDDATTGMPLVDYMGDVVFEMKVSPNMIHDANMLGIAREIAAATGKPLRKPQIHFPAIGASIDEQADIEITNPALNARFVLGLIKNVTIQPSPYRIQRRLRLAGMRPINNIVDATNYAMLEIGQPLHAFDYDVLVQRAGGKAPTIITRTAAPGETLTTLDGVKRELSDFTVLVTDSAGALSIAGVMGGSESEVTEQTRNILLEGANWQFINIRRTLAVQKIPSEAAYRFSRGVHPALATTGVQLGLMYMHGWGGGEVAEGLIDCYPQPLVDPLAHITVEDVRRLIGIELSAPEIAALLEKLEFGCRVDGDTVSAQTPPYRLDIGSGVVGTADLAEEVARMYGFDRIPSTLLDDVLPTQHPSRSMELEERVRDALVALGLQEVINYRLTSPEREARLNPAGAEQPVPEYVQIKNAMAPDRSVMRRSLLATVLDTLERNARLRDRLALFEIGPVFLPQPEQLLPDEPRRLVLVMTGLRQAPAWDTPVKNQLDFYDLKGVVEGLLESLHISGVSYGPSDHAAFHPGKLAQVLVDGNSVGVFGALHPLVKERYDFGPAAVLAAEFDLEALIAAIPAHFATTTTPQHPPVLEDIALVVDEATPAAQVEQAIWQSGGKMLSGVRLFDVFRSETLGEGKKSLAYSLTYQAAERTLTDADAAQIRQRIIRRLEQDLGAKLRS